MIKFMRKKACFDQKKSRLKVAQCRKNPQRGLLSSQNPLFLRKDQKTCRGFFGGQKLGFQKKDWRNIPEGKTFRRKPC